MSQTITIHTELAQEDRERIDLLITLLSADQLDKQDAEKAPAAIAPVEPEAPAAQEPAEDPAPDEEPQPQYTADDVRALVQKLATPAAGKKDAVKKIVNEYAPTVSGIPADKIPEAMAKLLALQEG